MAGAQKEDVVVLELDSQNSAQIHVYGATVISWVCSGAEHLFVSGKSHFDDKKAIRGGIPLVFPNFGPWECGPQHGFARINRWNLEQNNAKNEDGSVSSTFTLADSEATRKMWNFRFKLTYIVTIGNDFIRTEFTCINRDEKPFDFTCLLHTYFKVPDVEQCTISGLVGLDYEDKVKGGAKSKEDRDLVEIHENVDRVYENTPESHSLTKAAAGRTLTITKKHLPDTVVWNPWKEKAEAMGDFGDAEYPGMVCVEAGYVSQRLTLPPGETYSGSQVVKSQL